MTNHITQSVTHIRHHHPYCGIMILGDFNQLPDHRIKSQLHLKQIVQKPTRGNAILDKLFTNMTEFYSDAVVSAPVGRSDHDVVITYPGQGQSYHKGQIKSFTTRVNGQNERAMFAHQLQQIKWESLYHTDPVADKEAFFTSAIQNLYEVHFPVKEIKLHEKDKPWITEQYKNLIFRRQRAKEQGDMITYRSLRNQINRMTPTLRAKFYNNKIKHLKRENNKRWWNDIKPFIGIKSKNNTPLKQLAEQECEGNMGKLVENINDFFKSVTDTLEPITEEHPIFQSECEIPNDFIIHVDEMEKRLNKMKRNKAGGPDGLPAWIFKEFSHILAGPLASIANATIRQGTHPRAWKVSDTVPVPKVTTPSSIQSDLRPISLTPIPSKIVEYFPCKWIYDMIQNSIDPNQYGGVRDSSTTLALIHLIDFVARETDKQKTHVRLMLYDFSKAFDLVDHNIVIRKLQEIGVPDFLVKWVASFLLHRNQRVKIGQHFSPYATLNAGCPQGTLVGPLVFIVHINDLKFPNNILSIKYIDDTSVANASKDPEAQTTQNSANHFSQWSNDNNMKNNARKTKEMIYCFAKEEPNFEPICINGVDIERVKVAKLLGVMISDDLKWNTHIEEIIKKANSRLFFLTLLKNADPPKQDLIDTYTSLIRPLLEYACPVWHTSLPQYLHDDIECVQKRALIIICGYAPYEENLACANLLTLRERRENICRKMFRDMCNPNHKLHHLLPKPRNVSQSLRTVKPLEAPFSRTNRYRDSFIPYAIRNYQ